MLILGRLDEHMDRARHANLVGASATIALDTWGSEVKLSLNSRRSHIDRMRCLASLLEQGWQNQIVLGQDVFLKAHLHELVGNGYEHLPARVLPRLEQYGVPAQMMVANPSAAAGRRGSCAARPAQATRRHIKALVLRLAGENPGGDTAGSTGNRLAWECRRRRRRCGRF